MLPGGERPMSRVSIFRALGRYGLAAALVALALLFRRGAGPYLQAPFSPFYLAAILAARFAGLGPGLLATGLTCAAFLPEVTGLDGPRTDSIAGRLVSFEVVATITVWLIAALGDSRRRAEAAAASAREFEAVARRGEGRLRAILDNCPALIYVKDLRGRYEFINRACEPVMRSTRAAALGKDDRAFFAPEVAEAYRARDRAALEADDPLTGEVEVDTPRGVRTLLSTKFALRDDSGAPYAVCGISADITDHKRAERELRQAKEMAEGAIRAKDQFLAMLSHELRTPLTPVLLAVSALLEEEPEHQLSPLVHATLQMARRNIEVEARLIDDLLDLMRFHRGKMRLDRHATDAHALVRQAAEICRADVAAAGLRLDLDLAAGAAHVEADPIRVQQVAWNLIKNSVKFTPRGGSIVVRTRNVPAAAGADRPRLVVEVSDTGMGIAPEVLPRIFDPFEQGEPDGAPRAGGLGLGLAISRSVAEAHGGSLTASSPGRGHGSTFALELATIPRPAPVVDAEPGPAATGPGATARPLRILLVEDDPDTRRVLARLLRRRGHTVAEAGDLGTAVRASALGPFDLLISDLGLPDGSGLDLMRRLGTIPFNGNGHAPTVGIALSGFGTDLDVHLSKQAGFAEHLTKPIDFPRLEAVLHRLAPEPAASPGR